MFFKKVYNRIPDWNNPEDIKLLSDLNRKVDGKLPVFSRNITRQESKKGLLVDTEFDCINCNTKLLAKSVSKAICRCGSCDSNYKVDAGKKFGPNF